MEPIEVHLGCNELFVAHLHMFCSGSKVMKILKSL